MNRRNILLFLYAVSAVIFFEDANLVIIPKVIGGLLVVEYLFGLLNKRYDIKTSTGIWCLLYLTTYAMISYGFFQYDLPPEAITNIAMILVLSISVFNLVDDKRAYNSIILGLTIGVLLGFLRNLIAPQVDDFGRIARFSGTFGNPNYFALMINFIIAFILHNYDKYSKRIKQLILLFVVFSLYEIVMSGSKMGLLMYLINVLYLIFYIKPIKSTVGIVSICVVIFFLSGFLVSAFIADNSVSFDRFQYLQNIFSGKDSYSESDLVRYNLVVKGMDLWMQRPFFGSGYGSFFFLGGFGLYTHNNLVELLTNTGVVGFLIFHLSLIQLIVNGYRTKINTKKNGLWAIYFSLIVIVGSFGIVVLSDKLYWLLYFTLLAYFKIENRSFNKVVTKV
jgi:O-antigen ligase